MSVRPRCKPGPTMLDAQIQRGLLLISQPLPEPGSVVEKICGERPLSVQPRRVHRHLLPNAKRPLFRSRRKGFRDSFEECCKNHGGLRVDPPRSSPSFAQTVSSEPRAREEAEEGTPTRAYLGQLSGPIRYHAIIVAPQS